MNMAMKIILAGVLTLVTETGGALAQNPASAEARLKQLNITLPAPLPAIGNYVGAVQVGNLLFVSGTIPGPEWRLLGKPAGFRFVPAEEGAGSAPPLSVERRINGVVERRGARDGQRQRGCQRHRAGQDSVKHVVPP